MNVTATISNNCLTIDFKLGGRMIGTAALRKHRGVYFADAPSSANVEKVIPCFNAARIAADEIGTFNI